MGVNTALADRNQNMLLKLIIAVIIAVTIVMPFATIASAAQLIERSVTLSTSTADATGVTYDIDFSAIADAGAVVVEFCKGDEAGASTVGQACTTPTGLNLGSAAISASTPTFTSLAQTTANTGHALAMTGTIDVTDDPVPVQITLQNVTNPAVGTMYLRIVTFADRTAADAYTSTTPGTHVDDGVVGVAITNTIGVQGTILESMTFCVSGADIGANCGSGVTAPNVNLGTQVGSSNVYALDLASINNTGTNVFTQITTNASSGAIVRLKSNTTGCGGLMRDNNPANCEIGPAVTAETVSVSNKKFGVRVHGGSATSGTLQAVGTSIYDDTNYRMGYVVGDLTGVTSTYGDPFLDTNDTAANSAEMQLTFAASADDTTPAGRYSANLSLIATGTY